MRRVLALGAVAVIAWLGAACQTEAAPGPPDPGRVALQPGDVTSDLQRCPQSGDLAAYLKALTAKKSAAAAAAAHDELTTAWRALQREGATKAALTTYAVQSDACLARLGAGTGVTVSSLVVDFRDDRSAAAAYQQGLLGFSTPSEDQVIEDMERGAATGIGQNAWVLRRTVSGRLLTVGLWERDSVLVLFVAADEDALHADQAIGAIDRRIA